jgi:hypothetical protein
MNIKVFILSALLAATIFGQNSYSGVADEHGKKGVITGAPLGLLSKFRVKGEFALAKWFSTGAQLSYYYGIYPGFQLAPFARFYLGSVAPEGFYLQPFFGYYNHKSPALDYTDIDGNPVTDGKFNISGIGYGGALGYQFLIGEKKSFVIDLNIGFKSYNINNDYDISGLIWYTTGPGSFFASTFQIGYAF